MNHEQIIAIIKEIANEKKITVDWNYPNFLTTPFKQLGIDSLDLFDIVSTLEKRLKIRFNDETLMTLTTIEDLLNAIKTLI